MLNVCPQSTINRCNLHPESPLSEGPISDQMCVHFSHRLIQTGYLDIHVLELAALLPNHRYLLITLQYALKAGFPLQSAISNNRKTEYVQTA